jgi:tripartite ATP-independent transporter DctP family solute receptor
MLTRRGVLTAAVAFSACGRREAGDDRPLFAADSQPEGYPTVEALHAMDRILAARTNGEMRIRVYAGGQLGAEKDTLEITLFGGLDLNRVNLAPLNSIAPLTQVLALPFLFRSIPHMRSALDGAPGQRILEALAAHGLRGLCYYDSGARCFYNKVRPIRTPSDMAGLKIRVANSDIYVAMVQALGANPTPIPFGEVYQALVQGVVDGAENNWPSYESTRHYEAAPYITMTQHVMAPEVLVASGRRWNRLSAEQRAHLEAAARESVPIMRALWDERVETARRRVLADGVRLVEDLDHEAFATRMRPVWDRFLVTGEMRKVAGDIVRVGEAYG